MIYRSIGTDTEALTLDTLNRFLLAGGLSIQKGAPTVIGNYTAARRNRIQALSGTRARIARRIREIEDEFEKDNTIFGVADPAIWDVSYGTEASPAQVMERYGIYFDKGDHARLAGKMQMHYRMAFVQEGYPMLYVFDTCKDFVRTIPALVYDDTRVEDIDTAGEDHIYDETRYFLMTNPIASKAPEQFEKKGIPELDIVWR